MELLRFQQTIKEQAVTIHTLQNELQTQQVIKNNFLLYELKKISIFLFIKKKVDELKASVESYNRLEQLVLKKDEQIKTLFDQSNFILFIIKSKKCKSNICFC